MFRFAPKQFRCFYKPQLVRIAPITILLGENSTGKTSFLAAMRLLVDLFTASEEPDFNKEPFNLGAYDQIAHYRGGKFGRAKEFSFEISRDARGSIATQALELQRSNDLFSAVSLDAGVKFVKRNAQPSLSEIAISSGDFTVELNLQSPETRLKLHTPRTKRAFSQTELLRGARIAFRSARDFRFFPSVMRNLSATQFGVGALGTTTLEHGLNEPELRLLMRLVDDTFNEFRRKELKIFAPIRTKPLRTYDPKSEKPDPEGEHVPYLLARLKSERGEAWTGLKKRLEAFGVTSGLFEEIDVKRKGGSDSDPFQLLFRVKNQMSNLIDIGYGVSQIIPLLTEMAIATKPSIFLVQQPEVHLHPRAQAEFASLVQELFAGGASYCVLETHSDFIVDRIRYHIARNEKLRKEDVSIIFFSRNNHEVELSQIELDDLGNLIDVPKGYRSFFKREKFRVLGFEDVLDS